MVKAGANFEYQQIFSTELVYAGPIHLMVLLYSHIDILYAHTIIITVGSAWVSVTLEVGLTVGNNRCGLLDLGFLDNDLFDGSRSFAIVARLDASTGPEVIFQDPSVILLVDDNEGRQLVHC